MISASPTAPASAPAVPRAALGRSLLAPLKARLCFIGLDRELAAGVEPWRTPAHTARARRLTDDHTRRRLARSLERLLERSDQPPRACVSAAVRPCRTKLWQARPVLLELAFKLRSDEPLNPRGVAALNNLLTDGGGQIYTQGDPLELKAEMQRIGRWLDPRL